MANTSKYTGAGLVLGAVLGAVFGVMAGHVGVWLAVGVAIGMALGATIRRKPTECPECAEMHREHAARKQMVGDRS
jgi:hypothetical protein